MKQQAFRLLDALVRHPWRGFLPAAVLTLLGIWGSLQLRVDNSIDIWFVESDPELVRFQAWQEQRGSEVRILSDLSALASTDSVQYVRGAAGLGFQARPLDPSRDLVVLARAPFPTEAAQADTLRLLRALSGADHVPLASPEVMNDAVNRATMDDSALYTGLSYGLIFLLLFFTLRRLPLIGFALWVITLALTTTLGLWGISPHAMNIVTMIVPILVLVLSIADTLHLASRFRHGLQGASQELVDVVTACFWTSLTTFMGFASLMVADMPVIRTLGLFGAVGALAAFLATMLVLPAGLGVLGRRNPAATAASVPESENGSSLGALQVLRWNPLRVHLAFGVVFLATAWFIPRIAIDNDTLGFLPPEHVARQDVQRLESRLGGILEVQALVRTPEGRPDTLDLLLPYGTAKEQASSLDSLRTALGAQGLVVEALRGYSPLYARMVDYMLDGMIWSLATSVVLVFLCMAVFLRSLRLLGAALLPNLFPIACTLGYMGATGIPLDLGTVVVATILMGLVVDDTIHLLGAYRSTGDIESALRRTGSSLVKTSVVLGLGFLVLVTAEVSSLRHFGALATVGIATALLADLYWVPAFLPRGKGSRPGIAPTAEPGA